MTKKTVLTKEMIEAITERLIEMEGQELPANEDLAAIPDMDAAWYIAYKTSSPVMIDVKDLKRSKGREINVSKK